MDASADGVGADATVGIVLRRRLRQHPRKRRRRQWRPRRRYQPKLATVLQSETHGNGKTVRHAAEGGTFFVHVDENFAERAIVVFAGSQVDFDAIDTNRNIGQMELAERRQASLGPRRN